MFLALMQPISIYIYIYFGVIIYLLLVFLFMKKSSLFKLKKPLLTKISIYTLISITFLIPIFSILDIAYRFETKFMLILVIIGYFIISSIFFYFLFLGFFTLLYLVSKKWFKFKNIKKSLRISSLFITLIIISIGIINVQLPKTKEFAFGSGEKTLNITFLSDIHYQTIGEMLDLDKMVEKINDTNPDIVLLGGDIIDNEIKKLDLNLFNKAIDKIKSKYGIFMVLGNHEIERNSIDEVKEFIEKTKIKLLIDQDIIIDDKVRIVGRNDYSYNERKELNEIIPSDNTLPLIIIDHQPLSYQESFNYNNVLQLSGHTHKGQLFPLNIYFLIYYKLIHKSPFYGLYKEDSNSIYTTSGYGTSTIPMRIFSKSELVKIIYKY